VLLCKTVVTLFELGVVRVKTHRTLYSHQNNVKLYFFSRFYKDLL